MNKSTWKIALFCFSTMGVSGCANGDTYQPNLYSIDSLLNAQARYLSDKNASLTKIMKLGDEHEEVSMTPKDAASWKKELEIFAALDIINKPVNRDLYHLESSSDARSNLIVKAITTEEGLPVTYLKIYYQQEPDKIRKIEADYRKSNSLYKSARVLTMEFQQVGDSPVLTSYTVIGGQKMFLGDSVRYTISGVLTISN